MFVPRYKIFVKSINLKNVVFVSTLREDYKIEAKLK